MSLALELAARSAEFIHVELIPLPRGLPPFPGFVRPDGSVVSNGPEADARDSETIASAIAAAKAQADETPIEERAIGRVWVADDSLLAEYGIEPNSFVFLGGDLLPIQIVPPSGCARGCRFDPNIPTKRVLPFE